MYRGITPAWAGKSRIEIGTSFVTEDHPRVGGEKFDDLAFQIVSKGSPPRGRGKDTPKQIAAELHGITPAWAGKSQ